MSSNRRRGLEALGLTMSPTLHARANEAIE